VLGGPALAAALTLAIRRGAHAQPEGRPRPRAARLARFPAAAHAQLRRAYHPRVTALLAAGAVIAGAALASATGFGFSLLCAPLLFVLVGPAQAVGLLTVLGLEVNLLTLATEGRRPQPLLREAAVLLAWSIPGAVAGVAVLRALDAVWLQVALSVTVLATLAARRRSVPAERGHGRGAPLAGLAAGALTTSTSAAGPPLIIHLLGRGHAPGQVRDTLTFCFAALSPIGVAALLITGTDDAFSRLGLLLVLVPAVVAGHVAGRRGFARLAAGGAYEPVLTGILLLSVAAGLAGAIASA
jgi:uncharacterized membrane protein YfcA